MDLNAYSIAIAPLLPAWALVALGLLTVAAIAAAIVRRSRGVAWRGLVALVLLALLINPTVLREDRNYLNDVAILMVDRSASQRVAPRPAQIDQAAEHLRSEVAGIEALDLLEVELVDGVEGTALLPALSDALAEIPRGRLAGVVLLSDGQLHDLPDDPAGLADSLAIEAPMHLLRTGLDDERDRRLRLVQAPSFGLVGRELELVTRVEDVGAETGPGRPGRLARVTLTQDGQVVEEAMLPVGEDRALSFTLDHAGLTVLELSVEAGDEELTLANNRTVVSVNGVRDRLRVLLVSGEPHPGERSWRSLLKSDPSVDLVHFTILRPPEKQDGTPINELSLIAFPTRELFEVKLDEFDLVIFDRYRRRGVLPQLYLNNIADYVERGGALLEAVGPQFASPLTLFRTPLGRVLPGRPTGAILEQGFKPRVTPLGHRHPVTAGLSGANTLGEGDTAGEPARWGRWFRQVEVARELGHAVMAGVGDRPLIILDRVGEGRVAQVLSDHIWLWDRGFEGGGPQAELMRRVAHWLMKEPELEEEDLRARVEDGELIIERRSLEDDVDPVTVIAPSGESVDLALSRSDAGRFSATTEARELGLYQVSDGTRNAFAASGPLNPRELEDLRATDAILAPLIERTDGRAVAVGGDADGAGVTLPRVRHVDPDGDHGGGDWIGLDRNRTSIVQAVDEIPLLPALAALLLALGGAMLAWRGEGR